MSLKDTRSLKILFRFRNWKQTSFFSSRLYSTLQVISNKCYGIIITIYCTNDIYLLMYVIYINRIPLLTP